MATKKKTKGKLPWHSAFFAGIQIEFEKEAEKLTFENEHQLGTDPMRIDVLIIKKHTEEQIQKNIGRIFREYNIIEYKSPEQYLSIDAFYKVLGYACFYNSDVQHVDTIKVDGRAVDKAGNKGSWTTNPAYTNIDTVKPEAPVLEVVGNNTKIVKINTTFKSGARV